MMQFYNTPMPENCMLSYKRKYRTLRRTRTATSTSADRAPLLFLETLKVNLSLLDYNLRPYYTSDTSITMQRRWKPFRFFTVKPFHSEKWNVSNFESRSGCSSQPVLRHCSVWDRYFYGTGLYKISFLIYFIWGFNSVVLVCTKSG